MRWHFVQSDRVSRPFCACFAIFFLSVGWVCLTSSSLSLLTSFCFLQHACNSHMGDLVVPEKRETFRGTATFTRRRMRVCNTSFFRRNLLYSRISNWCGSRIHMVQKCLECAWALSKCRRMRAYVNSLDFSYCKSVELLNAHVYAYICQ